MRTATSNLVIITTEINDKSITGLAMDSNNDINIKFAVSKTDVNSVLFVPEANLVVTGNFRIAGEVGTIGMWIKSVIAVVSLPISELTPITASEVVEVELTPITAAEIVEAELPLTSKQKAAKTRAAKKAALAAV
jgi:hypothetical protein